MPTLQGTASGSTPGVQGDTTIAGAVGVKGTTTSTAAAVYGVSSGDGPGLKSYCTGAGFGLHAANTAAPGLAIYAEADKGGTSDSSAIVGESNYAAGVGVWGYGHRGVIGITVSATGTAVSGDALDTGGYAGLFIDGDLAHTGTGSKSFLIDHPVDPAGKYLLHACVESPDVKNVYDGIAVADSSGEALVELPVYFDALNRDFRYQLTALDAAAPRLHVKSRIASNRFVIAGAAPGQEVSWQVTGIRNDPAARLRPFVAERNKHGDDAGRYVCPRAYNQPREKGIFARPVDGRVMAGRRP